MVLLGKRKKSNQSLQIEHENNRRGNYQVEHKSYLKCTT